MEDGRLQVGVDGDRTPLPGVVRRGMPDLEGRKIQMEVLDRRRALAAVPAIREQNSADIEENHVEGEHSGLSVCFSAMNAR